MRILVANTFHYARGGDSAQFLALGAELEDRGHEVARFSMQHPENLPSPWSSYWPRHADFRGEPGVLKRLLTGWHAVYSNESGRRMTALLRHFAPDVVHFHSVQHQLTLAAVDACVRAGVPVAWTLHDYRSVCPAYALLRGTEVCGRCAGGRFWHGITGRCRSGSVTESTAEVVESYLTRARGSLGAVDAYVAPSRFLARKVLKMGLRAKRIEVVPNPVGKRPAAVSTADRRGLLYVGRLSVEKGVGCLIEAVAGMKDVQLCIVGDGPEADHLKALAAQLEADVAFEGWVDSNDVAARMARAQLLCVPSVWYENCPGVVLEAMAAGLPVVASDLGGLTELLDSGRAGWLVPPGEPAAWRRVIRRALGDTSRTQDQAVRALQRVRARHDPEAFIERIEDIYRSLLR